MIFSEFRLDSIRLSAAFGELQGLVHPMNPILLWQFFLGSIRRIYFHHDFEAKVIPELSEFVQRYDENRDGLWLLVADGVVEGSIVIDGAQASNKGAHLRWLILSDRLHGSGCGKALLEAAVNFCESRRYEHLYLLTFEGLKAARHLYEKFGFRLIDECPGLRWGAEVNEQRFELVLGRVAN